MGKNPYFPSIKSTWKKVQEYQQESTPSNPSSNNNKLYFKTDGNLYKLDSSGTETEIGASSSLTQAIVISASDETTALTTGTAKATFRLPYSFTLTSVKATLTTAGSGVNLVTVDVNKSGGTILSTKLTFDATEKTTTTALIQPVISDPALTDDSEITIDIDQIDSGGVSAGLKVYLIGTVTTSTQALIISASDETTALTTGTAKATFRLPYSFTLTSVKATLTTAGSGVNLVTVDVNKSGGTILSTKLTFDATEKTTTTALIQPVISDPALTDDSEITIDIDQIDSGGVSAGLKVYLIGTIT